MPSCRKSLFSTVFVSIVNLVEPECGFASTDATYATANREKLYWHKGKGALSCINLKQEKETEFSDVITSIELLDLRK